MNITTILLIAYVLILLMIILLLNLILRIGKLEKRVVDLAPGEVAHYVEQMREMVVESERVADQLDATIRQREEALEDLSDLVDAKLGRYADITDDKPAEKDMRGKITDMVKDGGSDMEIARALGISITEVKIVRSLINE